VPRFYLTTAIDYVNSPPHLGTAYEKITADVIARFKRGAGYETRFLMGNDEHSLNVRRQAERQELAPLDYCAKMEDVFRGVWAKLDISFDDFIRTTEERHRLGVQKLLEAIRARGGIYEGTYEGWYCVSCEAFKQEKDLEDGSCPLHKAKPDWITEKNHFFRLSDYRDTLLALYREQPSFIEPETRRNELTNVLEAGLLDLSVSRPGSGWGIPVPFDEASVVYVWFDALMNYLSATGYGTDEEGWDERWPADLHIVGKDITRFHAVIWPAMLMAAGVAIPRQVFGHGFVNFQGEKMSKSLGTAVDPLEAADHFGPDPLRLFLVREIQYGQDGDFSWARFEARYDADLANSLGNLVSRITSMAGRYRDGRLTASARSGLPAVAAQAASDYRAAMEELRLHDGAAAAFRIVGAVNESDVMLALTAGAVIIGFRVRPDAGARQASAREAVEIQTYDVIYEAVDDVRAALEGLLAPERRESVMGAAEARVIFKIRGVGTIAGSYVVDGAIQRGAAARVIREGVVIYDSEIGSLKRFKDDAREVKEGFECGIGIANFNDVKAGDIIETYQVQEVARTLASVERD